MANPVKNSQVLPEGKKVSIGSRITNSLSNAAKRFRRAQDEEYLKLTALLDNSKVLFSTKSVFPFDFFPDELIIDKDKVAIITQYFFASQRHQSILVKNISDSYVDASLLFATLFITDKYYADNSIKIEYLKKNDAIRARDIIQGLIICHEREVDISGMKRDDVLPYLEEIGRATYK